MCEPLTPFKVAVDALANEDTNMLQPEKIFAIVLKKLELQSNISKNLIQKFRIQINECHND